MDSFELPYEYKQEFSCPDIKEKHSPNNGCALKTEINYQISVLHSLPKYLKKLYAFRIVIISFMDADTFVC